MAHPASRDTPAKEALATGKTLRTIAVEGSGRINEAILCYGTAVMAEEVCMPPESKV